MNTTATPTITKTLNIGELNGSPIVLTLEIKYKGPEFTTTGELIFKQTTSMEEVSEYDTLSICGSTTGEAGQMQDSIREQLRKIKLNIPKESLLRILDIWDVWHLNEMTAACVHQKALGWDSKRIVELTLVQIDYNALRSIQKQALDDAMRIGMSEVRTKNRSDLLRLKATSRAAEVLLAIIDFDVSPFTWKSLMPIHVEELSGMLERGGLVDALKIKRESKTAGWVKPEEHPEGLLCKPCPECGYKYGSRWLVTPLSEAIKAEALELFSKPTPPAVSPLQRFIRVQKLTMECGRVDSRSDGLNNEAHLTRHFRCRIRKGAKQMSLYFSQGSAHVKDPTLEDTLESLSLDGSSYDNSRGFEDWAAEYGYEPDSRKAEKIYKAVKRQQDQLERLLGEEAYAEFLKVEV